MEYYSAKKAQLEKELVYNFINGKGLNISDLIRGQIMALDQIINMDKVFEKYEDLKSTVETNQQKGAS